MCAFLGHSEKNKLLHHLKEAIIQFTSSDGVLAVVRTSGGLGSGFCRALGWGEVPFVVELTCSKGDRAEKRGLGTTLIEAWAAGILQVGCWDTQALNRLKCNLPCVS